MRWMVTRAVALVMMVQPLVAAEPGTTSQRADAVESCAARLGTAQIAQREGRTYCTCMIDGLEGEFGADAYDREVDPGSVQQYMHRMLEIVNACAHLLPRTDSP